MNPIEYLVKQGFRITSDPTQYRSGVWGKRDYTVGGYNNDTYCSGYHRAYDLAKRHLAPIPAVFGGEVVSGTGAYGNFGGTVVVANAELGYQVIYGHLARNLPVKVGDRVKQGDAVGYQSNTNYDNVDMASHLHIQFQKFGYIKDERTFVCSGVDPLKINAGSSGARLSYDSAWLWKGKFKTGASITRREFPGLQSRAGGVVGSGQVFDFDKLYYNDGHWWLRILFKNEIWFVAAGKKQTGVTFRQANMRGALWGKVTGLDTRGGKEAKKKAL